MFGIFTKSAAGTFSPSAIALENRTKKKDSSDHNVNFVKFRSAV